MGHGHEPTMWLLDLLSDFLAWAYSVPQPPYQIPWGTI